MLQLCYVISARLLECNKSWPVRSTLIPRPAWVHNPLESMAETGRTGQVQYHAKRINDFVFGCTIRYAIDIKVENFTSKYEIR